MNNILKLLFSLQCIVGFFSMFTDKPQYSFPPNMGWIVLLGLIILVFEKKA